MRRDIEGIVACADTLRQGPPQTCEEEVPRLIMHVLATSADRDIQRTQAI
jgi:hypothetical protein